MACCQAGNKSKFEPMMTSSLTHTYVTKPQWVKPWHAELFEGNRIYLNFLSLLDTEISQWTYDAITTSLWRQNDVTTSCWRHNDIIISSVGDGADAYMYNWSWYSSPRNTETHYPYVVEYVADDALAPQEIWAPSQYKDRLIYVWQFPC